MCVDQLHLDGKAGGDQTVILPPNPAILIQSMRCIGYTLDTALADIIDNSITAGARNISVQFRWNGGDPWLAVIDDGCGMSKEKMREAMRFGGDLSPSDKRDAHDLGRFGLGLKTASLSQCRRLTVVSKCDGETSALEWNVEYLVTAKSSEWMALVPMLEDLRADAIVEPLLSRFSKHGTLVVWREMDALLSSEKRKVTEEQFTDAMARVSNHVALVFHRFLAPGRSGRKAMIVKMTFNGNPVEPFDPFGSAVPARRELTAETILIQGKKIEVQPFVLPHYTKTSRSEYEKAGGEEGYRDNQGFYVYRNHRLIVKGTWFRLTPKTELTKLLRVRVDIPNSLDHLWQLDVKKSQAYPPQIVLKRLKEVIQHITNEGRRVYTRRGARTVSDTVHIWSRQIADGKACYTLNENHPFVKPLVEDGNSGINPQKLKLLRVISGAFPVHSFHLDANNDSVEIVSPTQSEETMQTVATLIHAMRAAGLDQVAVQKQLSKTELPLRDEEIAELIQKEFEHDLTTEC